MANCIRNDLLECKWLQNVIRLKKFLTYLKSQRGGAAGCCGGQHRRLTTESSRFDSRLVLSVWSLHVLPVYAWVLSRFSGFLPPSKNMHVRLTGDSKIVNRNDCERVCGCLSLCGPVMDWRPWCTLPYDRWDKLSQQTQLAFIQETHLTDVLKLRRDWVG